MNPPPRLQPLARAAVAGLLWMAAAGKAHALFNLNEGRNKIFIESSFAAGYDTNLFAAAGGAGDSYSTFGLTAVFSRHAGIIGLDGTVGINANRFLNFKSEDSLNPTFTAQFTKALGRTQGSLDISASRQSRADAAANLRNESWNYDVALNLNYRVVSRYSIRPSFGFSLQDYANNAVAVDLTSFSVGADLFYVYSTDRDLLAGYRVRISETSVNTSSYDHNVSLGLSGRIIGGFTGQVRMGYSVRVPVGTPDPIARSWTANGNLAWNITKRWNTSIQVGKDFSTTSTNVTVDTLSAGLSTGYTLTSRMNVGTGLSYSLSRFLGPVGGDRADQNLSWNTSITRSLMRRGNVKGSLSYVWSRNFSNVDFSDFSRSNTNLSVTSQF